VEHAKDNGRTYLYKATVTESSGSNTATFTTRHGFSTFTLKAEVSPAAEIDGTYYETLQDAVDDVQDGQTIGVGAGQQSRIHCTRLAGQKADNWQLRHMPKVLDLPFREDISKPNRDNAIDVYIGDTPEDVIGDDVWAETFTVQPAPLTAEEKKAWLSKVTNVALGSDAFFPFGDNIERARRSGVTAIVQPGGSIRDDQVIATCNKYGIAMAFCGIRLFHH
jgi:phosphoribosylaminoimidazolecarboxamide formyltransferase/IMP cyclohydrolase